MTANLIRPGCLYVSAFFCLGLLCPGTFAQPNVQGTWGPPQDWGRTASQKEVAHLAVIPKGPEQGNVLFWRVELTPGTQCLAPTVNSSIWQLNGSVIGTPPSLEHNVLCAGPVFLEDGDLLASGGMASALSNPPSPQCPALDWPNYSHVFDTDDPLGAIDSPWEPAIYFANDCEPRYYPSAVQLPDGNVLCAGGGNAGQEVPSGSGCVLPFHVEGKYYSDSWEVFDFASKTWGGFQPDVLNGQMPGETLRFYPLMHMVGRVAPAQDRWRIFMAQVGSFEGNPSHDGHYNLISYLIEEPSTPGPLIVTPLATGSVEHRSYATSVLIPKLDPADNVPSVLILGGGDPDKDGCAAWDSAERIDLDPTLSPTSYQWGAPMNMGKTRVFQNAVILPDGRVFVVGGTEQQYLPGGTCPSATPLAVPVMYDPSDNSWTDMAEHLVARGYHSCAVLLPDARVLVAGGDVNLDYPAPNEYRDAEVYKPPYFYRADGTEILNRPKILDLPAIGNIPYQGSGTKTIKVWVYHKVGEAQPELESMVLVRPMAVTHHADYEQRLVALSFTEEEVMGPVAMGNVIGYRHTITVTGPDDMYEAPPGYYMLFALAGDGNLGDGVPSDAVFVHIP